MAFHRTDPTSARKHADPAPHGRWYRHAFILLFLTLLIGLGFRTLITGDGRYGWGTFARQAVWDPMYYWVYRDGRTVVHWPGDELRGEAASKISSLSPRNTRYNDGGMVNWVRAYTRYMYAHRPTDDIVAFRAVILYRLNVDRRRGGPYGRQEKKWIYGDGDVYRRRARINPAWREMVIETGEVP